MTQLGHDKHISGYMICHDLTACLDKRKYVLIVLIEFPIWSPSDPNIMTWVHNLKWLTDVLPCYGVWWWWFFHDRDGGWFQQ